MKILTVGESSIVVEVSPEEYELLCAAVEQERLLAQEEADAQEARAETAELWESEQQAQREEYLEGLEFAITFEDDDPEDEEVGA